MAKETPSSTSNTHAPKGATATSTPTLPTLDEFSHDAMNAAANAAVGFGFVKTIIASVGELAESNPALAKQLAEVGRYLAENLETEVMNFQDAIDRMWEGGAA